MEDFKFPDPPDPKDLPWWRRIPQMYYWWGASIVLLTIAFIWLPSQCSMDAFNLPQGKVDDLEGREKVNQDKDLEFGRINFGIKSGLRFRLLVAPIMITVRFVPRQK